MLPFEGCHPLAGPQPDDPMPFVTDSFREAGAFEREHGIPTVRAMRAALGACESLVAALGDDDRRFSVRFAATPGAGTSMGERPGSVREVLISSMPMTAPRLTDGQRAAIIVALAYHEVGHIRYSKGWSARLDTAYKGTPKHAMAPQVYNLASDMYLDAEMARVFPGFVPGVMPKRAYMTVPVRFADVTREDRFDMGVAACKFPWQCAWSTPEARAERDWWQAWGARCEDPSAFKPKVMLALVDEALDHIFERPETPPEDEGGEGRGPKGEDGDEQPSGPGGDEPPTDDEDGEGEDGDDDDGEGADDDDAATSKPVKADAKAEPKDDEPEPESEEGKGEGSKPALHMPAAPDDDGWQSAIDAVMKAEARGCDVRIVGGGEFHKREVRIRRLPRA